MTSTGNVAPDLRHEAELGAIVPDAVALALRAVHRAASELRRGTPVLITEAGATAGGPRGAPLVVAAAETVGARGLAEIAAAALSPPLLLLAPVR
ncbi:hypothetical protein ACFOY6_24020, partial [Pseudoroseomonas aestuarii]